MLNGKGFPKQAHQRRGAQGSHTRMKRDHIERRPRLYVTEIIESIEKIELYTKGLAREIFIEDQLKIDAVQVTVLKCKMALFR